MPSKKTISTKKEVTQSVTDDTHVKRTPFEKLKTYTGKIAAKIRKRRDNLLLRRPHRSFHRTRRRDYNRPLKVPGYWAFTGYVYKMLWRKKKLFLLLAIIYFILVMLLVGIGSQGTYNQLSDVLRQTSGDVFKGGLGEVGKASLLVITGITGGFNDSLTGLQQACAAVIVLFTWLTTVWLLRAVLAGGKPKLRDGLYNAGAPILPTFLVAFYIVMQLLPVAIAVLGFGALVPYGILDGGVEAMGFWAVALLLVSLSCYWITSTLIALVVVTLPGMYPFQAIKAAGDLVIGRRLRILLRFLWMAIVTVATWAIVMIPIILFDTWLKGVFPSILWLPLVPVALAMMVIFTVIWVASYVYLFYRRVVDDDSAPA